MIGSDFFNAPGGRTHRPTGAQDPASMYSGRDDPADTILQVFQSLGHGLFLLDVEKEVFAYNKIAAACLSDGLMITRRRVTAVDDASNARLQRLIAQPPEPADREKRASPIAVRRADKLPLMIRAQHLAKNRKIGPARLLLLTSDPERAQAIRAETLAGIFELTPTQAEIAVAIASGRRVAEIAADRGVKIETVRTHSKIIFAKTRTRGQVELAALLTRLAVITPVDTG